MITSQKISSRFDFSEMCLCKFVLDWLQWNHLSQNWIIFHSRHIIETALKQSITGHFNYLLGSKLLRRWAPLDLTESWPLICLRISHSLDFSINYPGIDINLVINFILRHVKWFISNNRNGSLIWSSRAFRKLCREKISDQVLPRFKLLSCRHKFTWKVVFV